MIDLNTIPKFVINLPERTDRLEMFDKEFHSFFPDSSYTVVEAVKYKDPKLAITSSHQLAVMMGYEHDAILIMEDDVKFTSGKSYDYAVEAYKETPNEADVLLGGVYQATNLGVPEGSWRKVDVFSAAHFYVIRKEAYDTFLKADGSEHIDRWMGPNLNCQVPMKFFAVQYNGYSDQVNKVTDYDYYLKKFDLV